MVGFMRHHGNFVSDVNAAMEASTRQRVISVDCRGLTLLGRFLADMRLDPAAKARRRRTRLALMMTCGRYDCFGAFAVEVGVGHPAKSGVGGAILAIAPGLGSMAVSSPNLDQQRNSILGVRALEMLAERTGLSVFGPPEVTDHGTSYGVLMTVD